MDCTLELATTRNDSWLHSHIGPLLERLQESVDFHLINDSRKVVRCVNKCVTKAKSSMTKGAATLTRSTAKITMRESLIVQKALKRAMAKLLGE